MARARTDEAWVIEETNPGTGRTEILGSKLLIANGYLGYRGTLEEHGKQELAGCTLSGIYDRRGDAWREPVNAPNGLLVRLCEGGRPLGSATRKAVRHVQRLDLRHGLHARETTFALSRGNRAHVTAERFASLADPHLLCVRYALRVDRACVLTLETGIDADVWDINGPHFASVRMGGLGGVLTVDVCTNEGQDVHVAEALVGLGSRFRVRTLGKAIVREARLHLEAGQEIAFSKFVTVTTGPKDASRACRRAAQRGYEVARTDTQRVWDRRWADSDVRIEGDPNAQKALRYSIYHLLCIAPQHTERASIPARGLSGQVYKGAIFWDTEMFMLPFFNHTQPALARNLVRYRFHTLPGARRKAKRLGYRGAFYAWESQETGDEACTLFNIVDVITNRPLRTYFADKQIHITADVAHGVWEYCQASGDRNLLCDGGAEVLVECARFFLSWSCYSPDRQRYELRDVTGPDEYHERVHNNAFTSAMARRTVGVALEAVDWLRRARPRDYRRIAAKTRLSKDLAALRDLHARLYVPKPHPRTLVIEQFDGYHRLDDVSIENLKKRMLDPREYLGGGQGLATTTQVIKQADVLTMLHVLGDEYSARIKKANWEFYEPRTEHGSSLSACIYALVGAAIGKTQWAYRYFLKTATIDLTGDAKQYVGSLYIGGTHPAANGGAWMAAVQGFGGLGTHGDVVHLRPSLPRCWKGLAFRAVHRGQWITVRVTRRTVRVDADSSNTAPCKVEVKGRVRACLPGRGFSA
jgi:trehalose/maltose hydrolase-like predicted phosphorylase